MAEEVELKLALSDAAATCLSQHELLKASPRRGWLYNTYYDTPQDTLQAARIALRIRRTSQGNVQTLKTAGSGSGGLSIRSEWEWAIEEGELDLAGLAELPPMQALGDSVLDALAPRFVTDFERCCWLLEVDSASIEVAFDQGNIRAGGQSVAINELELELKQGDPAALWQLAQSLAAQVPLCPSIASKAERGVALERGHWQHPAPGKSARARIDHASYMLDVHRDSQKQCFLHKAIELYQNLANDDRLSAATRDHARALADMLTRPDWLSVAFGQHSLSLQRTIL